MFEVLLSWKIHEVKRMTHDLLRSFISKAQSCLRNPLFGKIHLRSLTLLMASSKVY